MPDKAQIEKLRKEMLERHAAELEVFDREAKVLRFIKGPYTPAVIENRHSMRRSPLQADFSVSFHAPTRGSEEAERWSPAAILKNLENSGWDFHPVASLVVWGRYRPSICPCDCETAKNAVRYVACPPSLPESEWAREVFNKAENVLPIWIVPNQFTAPKLNCFMRAPDNRIAEVSIEVPGLPVFLSGHRSWDGHDWKYRPGGAIISYPKWEVHQATSAWHPTDQGLSGEVYFPAQSKKQSKASEFVQTLMNAYK